MPPRIYCVLTDLGVNGVEIAAHNNGLVNAERALKERVFFAKDLQNPGQHRLAPEPTPAGLAQLRIAARRLKAMMKSSLQPLTAVEFAETYTGRRRRRYDLAAEQYDMYGVQRRDSRVGAFVKYEKLLVKTTPEKLVPRIIQPREFVYNVALGRYIKKCEKRVFRYLDRMFGGKTVMKGLNALELGAALESCWNRVAGGHVVAYGMDASRFDQHCRSSTMQIEHGIYLKLFKNAPELRKLLSWQLRSTGLYRSDEGKIKYSLDGCRMSGDMNTGLGNCVLMCLMCYSYFTLTHGLKAGRDYTLANNGDDVVVFMSKRYEGCMAGVFRGFLEFGFQMEVEPPCDILEKVEFCQCKCVLTPNGYVAVRVPKTAMAKDVICLSGVATRGDWDFHRNSLSVAGLSMYGNIPVYGEYYKALGRGTRNRKHREVRTGRGIRILASGMEVGDKVDPESRYSFWQAFGVTPAQQLLCERELQEYLPRFRSRADGLHRPAFGTLFL